MFFSNNDVNERGRRIVRRTRKHWLKRSSHSCAASTMVMKTKKLKENAPSVVSANWYVLQRRTFYIQTMCCLIPFAAVSQELLVLPNNTHQNKERNQQDQT